jgi:hypothetical protein
MSAEMRLGLLRRAPALSAAGVLDLFDWSRSFKALAACLFLIVLFAGLP